MSTRDYNHSALNFIEAYTQQRITLAQNALNHICEMSHISQIQLETFIYQIQKKARIAVHFHPYRLNQQGKNVLELLVESKRYQSQFESNLSNGALDPKIGGKRDQWESLLFGNTVNSGMMLANRPKYGALDLFRPSDGPAPRFGSCFFVLKPHINQYATFTYLDSHLNPDSRGTIHYIKDILASLLSESFERDFALGQAHIRPHQLLPQVNIRLNTPYTHIGSGALSHNLDHYIEAQIHTDIRLDVDVDYLVVDQAFKQTEYEKNLTALCEKCEIELIWNKGRQLSIDAVPDYFRGNTMPLLARQIAVDQTVNAYTLAKAEQQYQQALQDHKLFEQQLQQLKYLWHTLVKYGVPIQF